MCMLHVCMHVYMCRVKWAYVICVSVFVCGRICSCVYVVWVCHACVCMCLCACTHTALLRDPRELVTLWASAGEQALAPECGCRDVPLLRVLVRGRVTAGGGEKGGVAGGQGGLAGAEPRLGGRPASTPGLACHGPSAS